MKLCNVLNEMPQNIPYLPNDIDLSNYSINKAKYNELIKLPKQIYKQYDDKHIVYHSSNMFFCLDYERKEITYYMEYDTSFTLKIGSFLWQSLVWRSNHVLYNRTLPHEIFFNVLLPKYGVIATDGQQTVDGKRFWTYQISHAFNNNLYVHYFNLKTKELIHIIDLMHFDKLANELSIWGDDSTHKHKLILISKHQLPKT